MNRTRLKSASRLLASALMARDLAGPGKPSTSVSVRRQANCQPLDYGFLADNGLAHARLQFEYLLVCRHGGQVKMPRSVI